MKGNGKKVASSLFSQIGLEYEVLSGDLEKIKKYILIHFLITGSKIRSY